MSLYLIPTPIGDGNGEIVNTIASTLEGLDYLVVENVRTARRFIATLKLNRKIDDFTFVELSEHTDESDLEAMLAPMVGGAGVEALNGGIMSEAGLPCVADPGAKLVDLAHRKGVEIIPLVGPSSIMLALMASGANGQKFSFNGYLPVKDPDRGREIKRCEAEMIKFGSAQIFIETPYRNRAIFDAFLKECRAETKLTIAMGLNTAQQKIVKKSIKQFKELRGGIEFSKIPAIFILG